MLTRSKQRLLESNKNVNKENSLNSLKRKRTTNIKKNLNKENLVPTNIGYALRSRNKPKENVLLKPRNENLLNRERKILKDKLIKSNNIIDSVNKPLKSNLENDHNIRNNQKSSKVKRNDENRKTIANVQKEPNQIQNKKTKSDPKMIVLIEGKQLQDKILNNDNIDKDIPEHNNKKMKIGRKNNNNLLSEVKDNNHKKENITLQANDIKKNNQNSVPNKPSILKKNNNVTKRKEKVTFDDKVKNISNSLIIFDSSLTDSKEINNEKISSDNKLKKIDDSFSIKQNDNIIVPFVKSDSESEYDSSIDNGISRKSSDLSDKSLELLAEFNKGGGKVQISDILESLNYKSHFKSSSPNGFNRTLLFMEESPINYTRILNEEMNYHTPLSGVKSPEKEVSSISQNTSFQDSNSLSNFINISPISNSHIHPIDSDFSHIDIQPGEEIDENELFHTDDKSLFYSTDELDDKFEQLLSNNEHKSILRYRHPSPENQNRRGNGNEDLSYSSLNNDFIATSSRIYPTRASTPEVEELTYDKPEELIFSQESSSDDPFGFSKAEKIYKSKQLQIKNREPHTPIHTPRYNVNTKESHSLDNVNEILLQERQQIIDSKKRNRNKKKLKVEDMEKLDSDDLEELKKAKDQQIKYFEEIDNYILNETVL